MGNFIVAGILAVIVFLIIKHLVKQWKAGHGFCNCGDCKSCGHCPQGNTSGCSGNCAGCKGCHKS